MDKKITAHMIVRNEDRFIWYSISSILPFVDSLIVFDTGSTDRTAEIIKIFKTDKLIFEEKGIADKSRISALRNEQVKMTKTPWIWIVDGDEVYPYKTVRAILEILKKGEVFEGIIVHRYDLLGDIYHYQEETVGSYNQFGIKGHYVLRLINRERIKNLQVLGNYPVEYYADGKGKSIKTHCRDRFAFIEERIFHAMYLRRSSIEDSKHMILNRKKPKVEIGKEIPTEDLPEVFFHKHPTIVPDVTERINLLYKIKAGFITPIKKIKRNIWRI